VLGHWTPLDSVVGENTMASVLRIPPWHVAAQTVAVFGRMRSGKVRRVARKASRPVVLHGLKRLAVGIVAGAAPKPSAAIAGAGAESKLLDMAYHFESASRRARRHGIMVDGEGLFQALPRNKVAQSLAGIYDASDAKQVTLFADAVAGRRLELYWINDRPRSWIRKMFFDRAMAALTSNGFR
jgi:hypothetical protein